MEDSELDKDMAQAAMLEPKRGPGRPRGSGNKSTSRTEIRKRVRAFRARQYDESIELHENQERLFKDMRAEGLVFFGETSPLVNCINIAEEIDMARLWARLLNVRDIQPGQNQKAYILEVMQAWCSADCPLLHLESQTLSKRNVDPPDINEYEWLDGSDEPYKPFPNGVDEAPIQTSEVTPDV